MGTAFSSSNSTIEHVVTAVSLLFCIFELGDSLQWMISTDKMYRDHPAMGTFKGYLQILEHESSQPAAMHRLAIVMGKWVGMAKFFLTGAATATTVFGNLKAKLFMLGWSAMSLMYMSAGLPPTLNAVRDAYPEDWSEGGVQKFWIMETAVGVICGVTCIAGIVLSNNTNGSIKND